MPKRYKDKAKDRRKSSSNDKNQEDIYRGDDAGDNEVIIDHASGDDNDDMDDISSDSQGSNRSSFDYRSDESDDEHCSFESKLKLSECVTYRHHCHHQHHHHHHNHNQQHY
jgi:hypothetical protein